jgi:XRE family transcriptional regulator, regulator of sulfur utilization
MSAAQNLAASLRTLRDVRGMTQTRLASLSGVPRPTLATVESGSSNPTLAVLVKLADALQVSVEELISPPRSSARFYKAMELPVRVRGGVTLRRLVPDAIPGIVVERFHLAPAAATTGVPHKPGTREYLCCETGEVQLTAAGETWTLSPGDVVVFRGDQRHGYRNVGDGEAVAYSVVLPCRPV